MTDEQLKQANKISQEIRDLERFIHSAENVWTGRLIKQTSKYIFKSNSYGAFHEAEYELDTEMKDNVLKVLKKRLTDLRKRLSEM